MPAALLEAVTKRLSMYVLRSKALIEKPEDRILYGLWGRPADGFEIGQIRQAGALEMLRTEDCPVLGPRVWLVAPKAQAPEIELLTKAPGTGLLPENAWQFSEIMSGLTWVWPETVEAFVPQMLNLELTQGVSFTKGCYPGQEIVARSQYLGKLKRRTFRADLPEDALTKATLPSDGLIGSEIWSGPQASEPVGQVVDAAAIRDAAGKETGGLALLVSLSQDAWAAQGLRLGSASGPILIARDLPYSFPVAA
jgi:folate-binding protein YgfZ